MRTCLILAAATLMAVSTNALADQPTAELQALDDALPGTLINDPTRLDWQIFGAGQTQDGKGRRYSRRESRDANCHCQSRSHII